MKEKKMYRQGDVLFVERACAPAGVRRVRKNGEILEGEATGHVHRVASECLAAAEVFEVENGLFMTVSEDGVSIVHEDHKPILLPAGNYEVIRQREYSPEKIRNVID